MTTVWDRKKMSFGFISTRFAGLDGVSLETQKWVDVLTAKKCSVFYLAGELDTDPAISHLSPLAHFQHPEIKEINDALFVHKRRTADLSRHIQKIKEILKSEIQQFHSKFKFDILVVQNALAIPVNIPLGLAIAEFIVENDMPTIAHHHDFFWERERFNNSLATDYLRAAFPPVHPNIQHVVINSLAGQSMGQFTGASWTLVPNALDFKMLPPEMDDYNRRFRSDIGLEEDTLIVLQPTRIVSRKGIEMAAELVKRIGRDKASLVITHEAGDEGRDYLMRIEEFAEFIQVDLKLIADRIGLTRETNSDGRAVYTLWDAYLNADIIVYPSLYEGYGNAFVETIYCKKPIVVNRYAIYVADIESKGFDAVSFDGYITADTVQDVRHLLDNPDRVSKMVETNYMLGWRYLSYEMLEEKLEQLLINIYGS